ncbi:D-aminoacyl-tRNA deacylase, partial [bacterium]|nr:D-aminoacyl-tRNA deacylase [bacterium]
MKIVLQKVREAAVKVNGEVQGQIQKGVCLLIGVEKGDGEEEARYLAKKIA